MKWFDYAAPHSLGEAKEILAANPGALPLAGGTDLLVQLRAGRKQTSLVLDLKKIPELNELRLDEDGLTLGAAVPCNRIYEDSAVRRAFPALAEVASLIGGTQIQNRASIGGNVCNAAPSADSAPLLIALGARCRIDGPAGPREFSLEELATAPGANQLGPGELLVALRVPASRPRTGSCYLRFIPRNEMDIAVAGAGVSVTLENGTIRSARIALASVAPTPLFVAAAGDYLAGQPPALESIENAARIARDASRPISDMRGSADYRRHLCAVLTRRALTAAIGRARGEN